MERWKKDQTVIKILSALKTRRSCHQMTLLIILRHHQKPSTPQQKPKQPASLRKALTEDSNCNHTSQIAQHDIHDLTTAEELINNLER